MPRLFTQWEIRRLGFEYDSEPYGKQRDEAMKRLAESRNIEVVVKVSHTLYDPNDIIALNHGEVPHSYKVFQGLIAMMKPPDPPLPSLTTEDLVHCRTVFGSKKDESHGIPKLEELGFNVSLAKDSFWKGGETEALERLECNIGKRMCQRNYTKTSDISLIPDKAVLGPYLRFGCLSSRLLFHRLYDVYTRVKGHSPALSFYSQILWREFIYTLSTNNPSFDKMKGNPICLQIPWKSDSRSLLLFERGRTGYPWIDAIIAQLRQEGWIHPVCRQALACFLTWGTLWISWEEGCKFFEDLLLDVDWTLSAGFWMWSSSLSSLQKFSHLFCPNEFGKQLDPSGNYVRRYLPVLKHMPDQYVYEPWKAPLDVQKKIGCVIGTDYPKRIVDHREVHKTNLERLRMLATEYLNNHGVREPDHMILPRPTQMPPPLHMRHLLAHHGKENPKHHDHSHAHGGRKRSHDGRDNTETSSQLRHPVTSADGDNHILHNSLNTYTKGVLPLHATPVLFFGSTPHYTAGTTLVHVTDIPNTHDSHDVGICSVPTAPKLYCPPTFRLASAGQQPFHGSTPIMSVLPSPVCVPICNGFAATGQQVTYTFPAREKHDSAG